MNGFGSDLCSLEALTFSLLLYLSSFTYVRTYLPSIRSTIKVRSRGLDLPPLTFFPDAPSSILGYSLSPDDPLCRWRAVSLGFKDFWILPLPSSYTPFITDSPLSPPEPFSLLPVRMALYSLTYESQFFRTTKKPGRENGNKKWSGNCSSGISSYIKIFVVLMVGPGRRVDWCITPGESSCSLMYTSGHAIVARWNTVLIPERGAM